MLCRDSRWSSNPLWDSLIARLRQWFETNPRTGQFGLLFRLHYAAKELRRESLKYVNREKVLPGNVILGPLGDCSLKNVNSLQNRKWPSFAELGTISDQNAQVIDHWGRGGGGEGTRKSLQSELPTTPNSPFWSLPKTTGPGVPMSKSGQVRYCDGQPFLRLLLLFVSDGCRHQQRLCSQFEQHLPPILTLLSRVIHRKIILCRSYVFRATITITARHDQYFNLISGTNHLSWRTSESEIEVDDQFRSIDDPWSWPSRRDTIGFWLDFQLVVYRSDFSAAPPVKVA